MIRFLKGTLVDKKPPEITIEVQGIGYEVTASMNTIYNLPNIGEAVFLHTHLIVREDAHTLYGFNSEQERTLFQQLIKVNGVGPKLAITVLSSIDVPSFVSCIQINDTANLVRLPGIGKKTAERLVIDLRDKLKDWQTDVITTTEPTDGIINVGAAKQDAISALVALGYKPQEAKRAIENVANDELNSEQLIRQGLRQLIN